MKTVVLFACIVILTIQSLAQSKTAPTSLDIGTVTVSLGMTRQEVVNRCAAAGYTQLASEKESILFQNEKHTYTVQFHDNRVVYADRDWYSSQSEMDAFQTTITALGSLLDRNNSSDLCVITHDPISEPDKKIDRIFISCDKGRRSFLLLQGKLLGNGTNAPFYGVMERIGQMNASSK
jgi:hypothetical protein